MTESTNVYDAGKSSITLQTENLAPVAGNPFNYGPIDPDALGRGNLYTGIKIIGIGGPPASGDYGQGLPAGQTYSLVPSSSGISTTVLIDTGSYETVLPRSLFDNVLTDAQLKEYPAATISYSSSGNAGIGVWVPMEIALTASDGSTVITKIPVIVPTDGTKFWMMGVGFNIGRGAPGSLPDTSTYGNAFLNIDPMAAGTMSRGYVIDGSGVHLGLDAADVGAGWAFQKLQPSPRAAPAGAPPDWQPATIAGTLQYPSGTVGQVPAGNLLMDTGISKTFIKTTDGLPEPPDGTQVSYNLFGTSGQVGYDYTLGSNDAQAPTVDDPAKQGPALSTGVAKPGAGTFVNTGQHFLSGFDYLYDADNGYLGVRENAAAGPGVRLNTLLSVSGPYAVPNGFAATVPLYLTGNTQLTVPGTATLSGGIEGQGTLTLTQGTLVLSGASATAQLALDAGTTLSAPNGLVLSSLEADGRAIIDVPTGQVVQVTSAPDFISGGLSVTGGGTLQIGTQTIASGQSFPAVPEALPGFSAVDTSHRQAVTAGTSIYTGPVAGITSQFISTSSDSLNVSVSTPNWFVHTGSGNDAIQVSSGTNVMDGGAGSNFLTGGSGTDTFFVDDRNATSAIWSTMNNFHSGDAAMIFGVNPQAVDLEWDDNQGAAGYTGLTLHALNATQPPVSLTLVGYTTADLGNGRLSVSFGTTDAVNGVPGSEYMYVKAN